MQNRVPKVVRVTINCIALLLIFAVRSAIANQDIVIYKDESKVISLDQFSEYALGNGQIADCVVRKNDELGAEVVINGVEVGTTNLIFWGVAGEISAGFNIQVKARDLGQLLSDVTTLLAGVQGVTAAIVGEKIIVKGEALTAQDMKKVTSLLDKKPHVVNSVTLGSEALKVLAKYIDEFVGGEGQIKVKPVDQSLVLYGTSYGEGSSKRVEEFAKIFHANVVNLIKERVVAIDPGADQMVQVHAHFMEVNNKAIEAMGASWSPLGSLDTMAAGSGSKSKGVRTKSTVWQVNSFFGNLLPQFSHANERNMGRQLQVSSVSVKSGENAEFHSGGELGYPVISSLGASSLEFKKYGMHVEVLPIAQGPKITLKIKIQVNMPTDLGSAGSGSASSYVNFTNSEIETVQYCSAGDSIAISGLIGHFDSKTFDASPSNSSPLFELSRSKEFQKNESQLIIFITPEILGQASEAGMEIKQNVSETFDSYDPIAR